MRTILLKLSAGCILIGASNWVNAENTPGAWIAYQTVVSEGKLSHVVDIDNDTLLLNRNDGFYTSGMRYERRYSMRDAGNLIVYGWRIGQDQYTASDIKLPPEQVRPPDHPYAGWLYGGFFKEAHRSDGSHAKYGIDIGCIGPCAGGEWTQTQFHRLINQPLPRGWSRQVKNEMGVVFHADVAPVRWTLRPSVDLTPSVNARFGNIFTDVGAGLLLRAGRLNVLPGQSTFHAFLRTDIHAVAYNATLQGGYFSNGNPHTVEPKRFVGEAEIGVIWGDETYGAKMSVVRRGNEIRELPDSRGAQNYLRLQFSYTP